MVQIQIEAKSGFEFVPRDTEKSEFLDFGDVHMESVMVDLYKYGVATISRLLKIIGLFYKRA